MSETYLKHLRKTVELNFPKDCYERYVHLVEPGIQRMIREYLWPWQSVEMQVTAMVMRHKGVFKTDFDTIDFEPLEQERLKEELDVKTFRKIEKWFFAKKISYLQDNSIIGPNLFKLLDLASHRRNRGIHKYRGQFTDEDLGLFTRCDAFIFKIYTTRRDKGLADLKTQLDETVEKAAKEILDYLVRR